MALKRESDCRLLSSSWAELTLGELQGPTWYRPAPLQPHRFMAAISGDFSLLTTYLPLPQSSTSWRALGRQGRPIMVETCDTSFIQGQLQKAEEILAGSQVP